MSSTTRSQTSSKPSISRPPSSSPNEDSSPHAQSHPQKPTIAIIGTGWAGWTLTQELSATTSSTSPYNIIAISPSRTMALTPLLASAACSIFDFRLAEEPIRRRDSKFEKYQALVTSVDFNNQIIKCKACIGGSGVSGESMDSPTYKDIKKDEAEFDVKYDKLILAPGCETNTFGTPGVKEYALFMKTVPDARRLREGILDCLERASLPTISEQEKKNILHFAIVGGGPTGIELAAEIDELIQEHLGAVYPRLKGYCTISIYDVADRLLGQFGEKLSEYAMEKFENRGDVHVKTGKHIQEIKRNSMLIKEEGEVPFGVVVWAVGNTAGKLVEGLECRKSEGLQRILTDKWLRVLKTADFDAVKKQEQEQEQGNQTGDIIKNVYALGDAADILNNELPTTAEVAVQKAKWLTRHLLDAALNSPLANSHSANETSETSETSISTPKTPSFQYKQKDLIAYLGRGDGVIQGKTEWTGVSAWLAWRSGSIAWTRGWRRRVMVVVNWVANFVDGREVARR
ncbi:hypothetical protein SS1G_13269 [Sclerotinia sclerotiorum 1980 UF-70]|uniref:FAD/NAD(P)-binding domain-containing protein n=2 Tax=Sclerotinia sclerotiorum (strain ATCC 18683 / 1980 / Ss-1) TaxID=665079 RepID=A7F6P0_SCLS1|nr:hypothetical protein SS1G_13269 [Sclerotinia sclerotiorum 1980 UF-70]APA08340.1 hypothetical protein sscle_03g031100 [Sclerotinia sclerotiorum 1980 UF-70]EDN98411.1 hypothetical protein SS1G_13269 [Sclerotinia sclerotiorum 1980 UF-70]